MSKGTEYAGCSIGHASKNHYHHCEQDKCSYKQWTTFCSTTRCDSTAFLYRRSNGSNRRTITYFILFSNVRCFSPSCAICILLGSVCIHCIMLCGTSIFIFRGSVRWRHRATKNWDHVWISGACWRLRTRACDCRRICFHCFCLVYRERWVNVTITWHVHGFHECSHVRALYCVLKGLCEGRDRCKTLFGFLCQST